MQAIRRASRVGQRDRRVVDDVGWSVGGCREPVTRPAPLLGLGFPLKRSRLRQLKTTFPAAYFPRPLLLLPLTQNFPTTLSPPPPRLLAHSSHAPSRHPPTATARAPSTRAAAAARHPYATRRQGSVEKRAFRAINLPADKRGPDATACQLRTHTTSAAPSQPPTRPLLPLSHPNIASRQQQYPAWLSPAQRLPVRPRHHAYAHLLFHVRPCLADRSTQHPSQRKQRH